MSPRRAAARISSALLLLLLLRADDPRELVRRAGLFERSAPLELSVRRLNGTAAAFDREFFIFLESVRRQLPPGAPGVAILGAPRSEQFLYLATYHFAPVPVLLAPDRVPPGWLLAMYGPERPAGWKTIAPAHRGALLAPSS